MIETNEPKHWLLMLNDLHLTFFVFRSTRASIYNKRMMDGYIGTGKVLTPSI